VSEELEPKKYNFHEGLQERILALLIQDPTYAAQFGHVIEPVYFKKSNHISICHELLAYRRDYKGEPSIDALLEQLRVHGDLSEDEMYAYQTTLEKLFSIDLPDREFIRAKTVEFARQSAIINAVYQAGSLVMDAEPGYRDEIVKIIEESVRVGQDITALGERLRKNWLDALDYYNDVTNKIPTKLAHLDQLMDGGPGRGTLNVVLGPPKGFKSGTLVNIACGAYRHPRPRTVVYYTFELLSKAVLFRMMQCYTGWTKEAIMNDEEKFKKWFENVMCLMGPEDGMIIKHFPMATVTVNAIKGHLAMLAGDGIYPDVIVVDYADLLQPQGSYKDIRHGLVEIHRSLKALAEEYDAVVWTASQCNREGARKKILSADFLAEAYEKAAVCDFMVALCQTKEDAQNNEMRLFLTLARETAMNQTINCSVHKDKMRMLTTGIGVTQFEDNKVVSKK